MPTNAILMLFCRHALGAGLGAMLLACAGQASAPQAASPVNAAAGEATAAADDYYALGRSRFAAGRVADALAAYRRALALDPAHVGARNGMAVLYAAEGDYVGAIAIWSALTGDTAPARPVPAYLFGNLGYAYLLAGDTERALDALRQACLLDPVDARAWAHLGEALRRAGDIERAAQTLQQAETLRLHDGKADYALAAARAPAAASDGPRDIGKDRHAEQVSVWPCDDAQGAARPEISSAPVPATSLPRLEISNANGVRGMAASLGRTLREADGGESWGELRLTNAAHFRLAASRIEYRPEQLAAARRLAQQLGTPMQVCRCARADVRLVLGRDLLDPAALRRHYLWQLAQARQLLAALRGS